MDTLKEIEEEAIKIREIIIELEDNLQCLISEIQKAQFENRVSRVRYDSFRNEDKRQLVLKGTSIEDSVSVNELKEGNQ